MAAYWPIYFFVCLLSTETKLMSIKMQKRMRPIPSYQIKSNLNTVYFVRVARDSDILTEEALSIMDLLYGQKIIPKKLFYFCENKACNPEQAR